MKAFFVTKRLALGSMITTWSDVERLHSASMAHFLLRASGHGSDKAESTIRRVRPCAKIVPTYRQSGEEYLLRK